jgi:uncharacterized protein YdeI (YjbR/CyaY-like superfamily)
MCKKSCVRKILCNYYDDYYEYYFTTTTTAKINLVEGFKSQLSLSFLRLCYLKDRKNELTSSIEQTQVRSVRKSLYSLCTYDVRRLH